VETVQILLWELPTLFWWSLPQIAAYSGMGGLYNGQVNSSIMHIITNNNKKRQISLVILMHPFQEFILGSILVENKQQLQYFICIKGES